MNKEKELNLITGNPFRQLVLLLFPLLICSFFQQIYALVNNIIVGRQLGTDALAVINGSAANLINIFYNFTNGLSVGAMILVAQLSGENNMYRLEKCMKSALVIHVIFSLFMTSLFCFLGKEILTILSVPNDILADTSAYIKLYAVGFMFYSLTMLIISIQRGKGDLKQPTIELLLLYLLNILMDLLFVRILNLGLTGVSLSFITTYFLSTVYLMIYLHKHYHVLSNKVSVDMSEVKIILYIGIPTSLASMFYDVANTYTQTAINKLGNTAIAAIGLSFKIENFFYAVMQSMSTAAVTLLANNIGAKRKDRIKPILFAGFIICYGLAISMSLFTYFGRNLIPHVFTDDISVIEICAQILVFISPFYLIYPVLEMLLSLTRSIKKIIIPTVITLIACLSRIVWIYFLPAQYSILEAKFSYPLSWIVTSSLMLVYCLVLYKNN